MRELEPKSAPRHWSSLLLVAVLIAVLVGCLRDFRVLMACKILCDNFAGGMSGTKAMGFVAWVLAIVVLRHFPLRYWKPGRALALSVGGLCLLVGGIEHVVYCQAVGTPPLVDRSVFSFAGAVSANGIGHMHVTKSPLGWLFQDRDDLHDLGEPYALFYPDWWLAAHFGLLLICALLLLLMVRGESLESGLGQTVTLSMASYSIFKALVDGGPLWLELHVSLTVILFLFWGRKAIIPTLFLLVCDVCFLWFAPPLHRLAFAKQLFCTSVILLCPLLAERLWSKKRGHAVLSVMVGLGLLYGAIQAEKTWVRKPTSGGNHLGYARKTGEAGQTIFLVARKDRSLNHPSLELTKRYVGQSYALAEARVLERVSYLELGHALGLNLIRRPVLTDPKPAYVQIRAVLFDDWPADWPSSELVKSYQCRVEERTVVIDLEMRPGSNYNATVDALPRGPMYIQSIRRRPAPGPTEKWLSPSEPPPELPRAEFAPTMFGGVWTRGR